MVNYTFTITSEDVNVLGVALSERPFKEVNALIVKLNQQLIEQQASEKEDN